MEVHSQVSYNGYRADYKIISINSIFFYASLIDFSGSEAATPPRQIHFICENNRTIASSDVIRIARDLLLGISGKANL